MSARTNQFGNDVSSILKRLGVSDARDVIPLLQFPNRRLAERACFVLGQTRNKASAPFLLEVLKGKRPSLWMQAAVAIS
jgi:hypothetical protein